VAHALARAHPARYLPGLGHGRAHRRGRRLEREHRGGGRDLEGDTTLKATGLGAYITAATTAGDRPRIVLGVAVMSAYVVALNRFVWRRLERLAAARYSLA